MVHYNYNSFHGAIFRQYFRGLLPRLMISIIYLNLIIFGKKLAEEEQDQNLTKECCLVKDAELKKFQHIRAMSDQFLLILGVQKSGTTVMFSIMNAHPDTSRAITKQGRQAKSGGALKELHFFDTPGLKFENYIKSFNMSALKEGKTVIEGTPEYLQYAGGACLIKYYLPNAKFIVIMKNPAYRALSAFKMRRFLCDH
eukprot:TRINITY_DN8606_c0_g1_i5.p1 TRINITY_DN8606_c0_g1~~TRINITY_DN8606_c0_g1_i5.p1  ORF type:complete len:198 (-),score=12.68 TRINITY_DN8606_c0_g1_i5:123-716(-)